MENNKFIILLLILKDINSFIDQIISVTYFSSSETKLEVAWAAVGMGIFNGSLKVNHNGIVIQSQMHCADFNRLVEPRPSEVIEIDLSVTCG
jgi:hypothetical protein